MSSSPITFDDVVEFAQECDGIQFSTLARKSPFTIHPNGAGIRYKLPNGARWSIKRETLDAYIDIYNSSSPSDRLKTSIYPDHLRERSYMTSIFHEIAKRAQSSNRGAQDGLNDVDAAPEGNAAPDRAASISWAVVRDPKVRRYVVRKSGGKCEHCGERGFRMKDGRHYVEAHHIILLAAQGKDTVDNVIALCPAHHRESHYGEKAESLERKFIITISKRRWEKEPNK